MSEPVFSPDVRIEKECGITGSFFWSEIDQAPRQPQG
jgi:hypothetical protein